MQESEPLQNSNEKAMEDQQRQSEFERAVELFNQQEFFACHDVLEEIWSETIGSERDFYQGLIHAAVALFHFSEGNLTGARKMHDSALRYLAAAGSVHCGLDLQRFRTEFDRCFAPLLGHRRDYPDHVHIDESLIPKFNSPCTDN